MMENYSRLMDRHSVAAMHVECPNQVEFGLTVVCFLSRHGHPHTCYIGTLASVTGPWNTRVDWSSSW